MDYKRKEIVEHFNDFLEENDKVNSIYIDTKELGCPQILELENNYKIRLSCYNVNPNDLITEIKKG